MTPRYQPGRGHQPCLPINQNSAQGGADESPSPSRLDHEPVALRSRWSPVSLAMSVYRADGKSLGQNRERIVRGGMTSQQHRDVLRTVRPKIRRRGRRDGERILPTTGQAVARRHERARGRSGIRIEVRSQCVTTHRTRATVECDVVTTTPLGRRYDGGDEQRHCQTQGNAANRTRGNGSRFYTRLSNSACKQQHRGVSVCRNGTHQPETCWKLTLPVSNPLERSSRCERGRESSSRPAPVRAVVDPTQPAGPRPAMAPANRHPTSRARGCTPG